MIFLTYFFLSRSTFRLPGSELLHPHHLQRWPERQPQVTPLLLPLQVLTKPPYSIFDFFKTRTPSAKTCTRTVPFFFFFHYCCSMWEEVLVWMLLPTFLLRQSKDGESWFKGCIYFLFFFLCVCVNLCEFIEHINVRSYSYKVCFYAGHAVRHWWHMLKCQNKSTCLWFKKTEFCLWSLLLCHFQWNSGKSTIHFVSKQENIVFIFMRKKKQDLCCSVGTFWKSVHWIRPGKSWNGGKCFSSGHFCWGI